MNTNSFSTTRFHVVLGSMVALALLTGVASAQTTYKRTGTTHNNNTTARWEHDPATMPAGGANWDQTVSPGSALNGPLDGGALDNIVLMPNGRPSGATAQVTRLRTNAGTIGSLRIGGSDGGGGTGSVQLQLNANGSNLVVTGDTTIGFGTNREGRFLINGGTASAVLQDVVSASTNGSNQIYLQGAAGASLTINGDIDSADTDGIHEIDLNLNRGGFTFGGAGAQTFHVETLNIVNTGLNFGGSTYTVPAQKLIKTSSNAESFISRVANNNRTYNSTLSVAGTVNFGRDLQIGAAGTAGTNSTANATGTLSVDGGTVTIGRELRLATITVGTQTAAGNLVVNSGSIDIDNGIDIGTGGAGTRSGTITVNGGTVTHREAIVTAAGATSTLNLYGGTFATEGSGARNVGTIDWTGGTYQAKAGTIFSAGDIALSSSGTLDILSPGGAVGDVGGDTTWDGSVGNWILADGGNWDTSIAPDGAIAASGTIVVMKSTNAITGTAPGGTGTWTPAIGTSGIELVATTSAAVTGDPLRAIIDSGTVNRSTDIDLGAAPGSDAATLIVSGGLLNASAADLNHGVTGSVTTVNFNGTGDTTVANYYYQNDGGTVNLDGSATLNVLGDIVEGAGGTPDTAVPNAQLYIDNSGLTVAGDITTQSFRLGESSGTTGTYTVPSGQTLTNTGTLYVGNQGIGNLTVAAGGTVNSIGNFIQEESNLGAGGSSIVVNGDWTSAGTSDIGRRDPGTFTVNTGGTMTHTGALRFSASHNDAINGVLNVAGGTVTVTGNITKGTNNSRDAFINVTSGGQFTVGADLNFGNQNGLTLTDGRIDFLHAATTVNERRVQNLTIDSSNSPTLAFAVAGGGTVQPITVTNVPTVTGGGSNTTTLSLDTLGGSESTGGSSGNIDATAVWNAGGSADWNAAAANWDAYNENMVSIGTSLPSGIADSTTAGNLELTLIDGPSGTISTTLFSSFDGNWDVTNAGGNLDDIGLINNATVGTGPGTALISNGSTVTSSTLLRIGLDSNADASQLTINGSSTLDLSAGPDDLIIGGGGLGVVNQGIIGGSGATVSARNLLFGGSEGASFGGTYNLNAGSLTLSGTVREGTSSEVNTAINTARLNVNGGTLSVTGTDIDLQDLAIGSDDGSNGTWATTTGQDINITGRLTVGGGLDADLTGATGTFTVGAGSTVHAADFRIGQNGKATGTLNVPGTLTFTSGGNVGGDDTNTDNDDDTTGTINLTGSGSLIAGNAVQIGRSGDGFLNISDTAVLELTAGNLVFAQNQGTSADDDATATIVMTGGALKVSGANNDLNMNNGEVDYTQSGGTLTCARNLNLVNDNVGDAQVIFSGTSIANIAGYIDYRGGTSGDTITVQDTADINVTGKLDLDAGADDRFKIVGAGCSIDVGSINADGGSTFEYEFDTSAVSGINVAASSTITSAVLVLSGTQVPSSGTVTLIDNATAASTGEFVLDGSPLTEGASFTYAGQNFSITYVGGGDNYDVVLTAVSASVISIAPLSGDVTEGTSMTFDLIATPAGNIDVTLAYTGTATGGGVDYTGTIDFTTAGANTTLTLPTVVDTLFESFESVTVTIAGVDTNLGIIGTPSTATSFILDSNNSPRTSGGAQAISYDGMSDVDLSALMAMDDTENKSRITSSSSPAAYHYTGITNQTWFQSPFTNTSPDDHSFTPAPDPKSINPTGFSMDLEIKPSENDVAASNSRIVWEIGGASNGTNISLIGGVPHLISKINGGGGDQPASLNDTDFADGDNSICVPLSGSALKANERVQIAVIYKLDQGAGTGTIEYSVDGSAAATHSLTGTSGRTNWAGAPGVTIGNGGEGGMPSPGTAPFLLADFKKLDNAPTGQAYTANRFWTTNDGTMGIFDSTAGAPLTLTATISFDSYTSDILTGTISDTPSLGTYAAGTWSLTTDIVALNTALADIVFSPGSGPPNPVILNVSIDDGVSAPVTSQIVISTPSGTVYIDDDFTGDIGSTVGDADDGTPGVESGTIGFNAFADIVDALPYATTTATLIVNDNSGGTEYAGVTPASHQTLRLTGSGGSSSGSTVDIASLNAAATNSIDLGAEALILGNNAGTNNIDAVISGTGTLTKEGTDRLRLRNTNTYSGDTFLNEGALEIGFVASTTAPLQGSLPNSPEISTSAGTILDIGAAIDTTVAIGNLLSGDGQVRTFQDGTVEFTGGPNTFSGGFRLGDGASSFFNGTSGAKQGFVIVNDSGDLGTGTIASVGGQLQANSTGVDIANDMRVEGGGLRMGGWRVTNEDFELSGTIEIIGGDRGVSNVGLEGRTITLSGPLDLDQGGTGRNANFEGSTGFDNGDFIVSGDISGTTGSDILVQGNLDLGTVTLGGTNTYPGVTTVNGTATLILDSTHTHTGGGNYTVASGGTLGGNGSTESAVIVQAGGTLSPGTSIGTISTGNLTLNGTLLVEVSGLISTTADLVEVTGTVTAGNGEVAIIGDALSTTISELVVVSNDGIDSVIGTPAVAEGQGIGLVPGGPTGVLEVGDVLSTTAGSDNNDIAIGLASIAIGDDSDDLDTLGALLELAFGTDYKAIDNSPLVDNGNGTFVPGTQIAPIPASFFPLSNFKVLFVRRVDHATTGITYTPEFSHDLSGDWTEDPTAPTPAVEAGDNGKGYELVSVPYMIFMPGSASTAGKKARYMRIRVNATGSPNSNQEP